MSADIIQFPGGKPMGADGDFIDGMAARIERLREEERNDPLLAEARRVFRSLPKSKKPAKRTKAQLQKLDEIGDRMAARMKELEQRFAEQPLRDENQLSPSEIRQVRQLLREVPTICSECPVAKRILERY